MSTKENPSPHPQDHYSRVLDGCLLLLEKQINILSIRHTLIDLLNTITEEQKKYIDTLIAINNSRTTLEIIRSPEKNEHQNRQRDNLFLIHVTFLRFLRDNIAESLQANEMKKSLPDSWFLEVYIQYFL